MRQPTTSPVGVERRSIALYYLSPPRPFAPARYKAMYVPTPGLPDDPALDELRAIRSQRRLVSSDFS